MSVESTRYVERRHELAIGLEPRDRLRDSRVAIPLLVLLEVPLPQEVLERLVREGGSLNERLPALHRAESCRFTALRSGIRFDPAVPFADVRVLEGRGRYPSRRFVPRRFRIPLGDPADHESEPISERIRRPALLPGSDYPIHESVTALRGRVVDAGDEPVRWARVEARLPLNGGVCPAPDADPDGVIAVAHGDDRGEFLLVLPTTAAPVGSGSVSTQVCVRVWAAPALPPAGASEIDPYWDLPLEALPLTADGERVSAGVARPPTYTRTTARIETLRLGRTTSGVPSYSVT